MSTPELKTSCAETSSSTELLLRGSVPAEVGRIDLQVETVDDHRIVDLLPILRRRVSSKCTHQEASD